jgi:hypothetical protein
MEHSTTLEHPDTTVAVRLLSPGKGYVCSHLHIHDIDDVCSGEHHDHDGACGTAPCFIASGLATDITRELYDEHSGRLWG